MSSTAPSEQTKSKEKYFFFYGHNDKDGPKACTLNFDFCFLIFEVLFDRDPKKKKGFSNWYPAEFKDKEGRRFGNSEQYMMWRKAVLMKGIAYVLIFFFFLLCYILTIYPIQTYSKRRYYGSKDIEGK